MNNLIKRGITGLLYVGVIVGALLAGTPYVFALSLLLTALGVYEFCNLSYRNSAEKITLVVDILGALILTGGIGIFCLPGVNSGILMLVLIWIGWLLGRFIIELYIIGVNPLYHIGNSLMSQFYIALPLGILNVAYSISHWIVLLMFILIWLNDTGAYLIGCSMGKHRLFERISPKKSWEGFFGGMIFSVAGSVIACFLFPHHFQHLMGWLGWALFGITVSAFSTWGDLVESLIKRTVGVKDSGTMLPGHGGILDRIDSLLFVAPLTFLFVCLAESF